MLKLTSEMVDVFNRIVELSGGCHKGGVTVGTFERKDEDNILFSTHEPLMAMAVHTTGTINMFKWSDNVILSEVDADTIREFNLEGKYVLWVEEFNHGLMDPLTSQLYSILDGYSACEVVHKLR